MLSICLAIIQALGLNFLENTHKGEMKKNHNKILI